jgi:hypothetical protein
MSYYLDHLRSTDFDKKKIYEMIKQELEQLNIPVEDAFELDFLARCAQSDFMHYAMTKMGYYSRLNFDENRARNRLCKIILYKEHKLRKVVHEWTEWWFLKWRQRVKIIFETDKNNKNQQRADFQPAEELLNKVKKKLVDYYRRLAICALIEVGEICSLDVVSDYLLKNTVMGLVSRYGRDRAYSIAAYRPDLMKVELMKKAVEIARTNQPLVVLKVRVNMRNGNTT